MAFNPPYYTSPEVQKGILDSDKCDMWSVGSILYSILGGHPPFYE